MVRLAKAHQLKSTNNYNLLIDVTGGVQSNATETIGNHYQDVATPLPQTSGQVVYDTGVDMHMADYSFQYERFTASPKNKTLVGVCSTPSSPHYGVAGSSVESNI